jgi:hypothetical protein
LTKSGVLSSPVEKSPNRKAAAGISLLSNKNKTLVFDTEEMMRKSSLLYILIRFRDSLKNITTLWQGKRKT